MIKERCLERFIRYVKMDTQSREDAGDKYPSTDTQIIFGNLLKQECENMGLSDVRIDPYGYVFAALPGNVPFPDNHKIPVIGFLAHMDTSPEVSGSGVQPVIHTDYKGGDIILPGDSSQVIRVDEHPDLKAKIGEDIITSNGTTLLGADNKVGIAEILTFAEYLIKTPEIFHGDIRICFTPDEEIGAGTKFLNINSFGADFAYTVDGEGTGVIENESFNASTAAITIKGVSVHPGYAKNRLVNALRIASDIITFTGSLPAPENTEAREGYVHPYSIQGGSGEAVLKILLRDFELKGIDEKVRQLENSIDRAKKKFPDAVIQLNVEESYRNMRLKLQEDERVVDYALEAVEKAGIKAKTGQIRGGTDGARLSYMGLLTPNIFTGGHSFHSKTEWISLQDMVKTVETLICLVRIWAEKTDS